MKSNAFLKILFCFEFQPTQKYSSQQKREASDELPFSSHIATPPSTTNLSPSAAAGLTDLINYLKVSNFIKGARYLNCL